MPTVLHPDAMRLLLRSLALPPPCRSLLVAPCKGGELCLSLAEFGLRITGVDRDENLIAFARERSAESSRPVSFQVARTEQMSFADRHFDAVLCLDFYPWLGDEAERWRLVDELCRVAGRYVLLDYAAPLALGALGARLRSLQSRHPHATRTYRTCSLASLREKFERHGFLLHADRARQRFVHPQHIASFRRI